MNASKMKQKRPEELTIYAERHFHFLNLWTVYHDFLKKVYVPSLDDDEWPVGITLMFVLYSYFYSLVEDSNDGLNGFRVWRERLPQEEAAIASVEAKVHPFLSRLRIFRNRMGFHGSRSRNREFAAFDLFNKHSGTEVYGAMKIYKSLAAALFRMDMALHANDVAGISRARGQLDRIARRQW